MIAFSLGLLIGFVVGAVTGVIGFLSWMAWTWKDTL